MQNQTTTVAPDTASEHRHPFWCVERDEETPADHEQHLGAPLYAELQEHSAFATVGLAQLDWRQQGEPDAYDLRVRLTLESREMAESAEAYMTVQEAEMLREVLGHRIDEARRYLAADREHSRGWALGAGGNA